MRRPASTPPDLPGYTFVKLLGSGGFSDVFLYDQKLPKRRVAVKVLLTDELTQANRAAFVAEANLMAQLSAHPYIVTIYQADVASDDRPYFVMEYCSGPSLAERYKREAFSVADALRTGVRLSSAVATAHAAGILHRDIKPANVLSNDYGWPALTDFGISSAVDDDAIQAQTITRDDIVVENTSGTGQSIGMSVPWSPPEMFEDDPEPDPRSDVFSLAATIYTILAGQSPFEVKGRPNGTLDLIGRIERGAITPMSRDDLPRSLTAVLQKGMATDRNDRFASAVDFARALQRIELELGYAPTSIEVPNLLVHAPDRDDADDAADETRARGAVTIEAQPAAPAPASPPVVAEPPRNDDATLVRGATSIVAQPAASTELPSETVVRRREPATPAAPPPPPPAPEPSRRRVVPWIVGSLAAVIAIAVAVSFIVFGPPGGPQAGETPEASAPPVVIASVPTPELVSKGIEGGVLLFVVSNPDPEDEDAVVWRISNRTEGEALHRADGDRFDIPDYVDGTTVCVEISILRSGKTSPKPLEECYPS
jgi:serine/threonine protein kinase